MLEDILLAPNVTEIALSGDRQLGLYSVETADIANNEPQASLRIVNMVDGAQRELLRARSIKLIKRIPKSDAWSGLLDIGAGQQLYRIERSGAITPILINETTVLTGRADMALSKVGSEPPRQVGVLAYDWSPNGQQLWYSLLKPVLSAARIKFDDEVLGERNRQRSHIEASVEFHLRGSEGDDRSIMTRPSTDRMALLFGGNVVWQGDEVQFRVETGDGTAGSAFETRAWNRKNGVLRVLGTERDVMTAWLLKGPRGGALSTTDVGETLELVERLPSGKPYSYGDVRFSIGDPRSAGFRRSKDGKRVVVGTRTIENPRYGLAVIDGKGVHQIGSDVSLTRCDFDDDVAIGFCVREGVTYAPDLVRVDLKRGDIARIASVSPQHEAIAPLTARPRTWVNRLGYKATGFVIFPRHYVVGRRYPAIVVTHGSDADERFANIGMQWNYPVQLFAERGYVVLLINDPSPRQKSELWAAYDAWTLDKGPPSPEEVQRLIWVNGVYSFEDAVREMGNEGLVDLDRIGIAGFSRGSQMVNVALTHSKMFRAASGGDGSFLDPYSYPNPMLGYNAIFGGSPFGEHIDQYRSFSPSLNAEKVCAPLLQQMASPMGGALNLYTALRQHSVPAQITYYPGESSASDETHVFHIPSNRLLAMRENLAWFDYWLLGRRDVGAPFPGRLALWDQMAQNPKWACGTPATDLDH